MPTRKILASLAAAFLAAGAAWAVPVGGEQAATAVGRWLRADPGLGCRLGTAVAGVRTCVTTNGVSFHVVRLTGGGFAVTSADTQWEPVVAFSSADDLEEVDGNPLWALLKADFTARGRLTAVARGTAAAEAKWARLLDDGMVVRAAASVSDVRVAPLVQSRWNQGNVGDGACYNYYTPGNYVCGCVATAGGQLMRHFAWPVTAMAPYTCDYCAVDGTVTSLTTQGGVYDWAQMPLVPTASITQAARQAIGKLTSDVGICCGMYYASGGSGTGGYMLTKALVEHFGYSGAKAHQFETMDGAAMESFWNALRSNLDAGLPVGVGIRDSVHGNGHFVIGDGYGYSDGTLYCHFNMGWGGTHDAWYAPPDFAAGSYAFDALETIVYNIYTNQSAGAVIVSGRVVDAAGNPVAGAEVAAQTPSGTTVARMTVGAKGIYAFLLQPGNYTLVGEDDNGRAARSVSLSACVSLSLCDEASGYFGSYWLTDPLSSVGNRSGQDIVLTGTASVEAPVFDPPSCVFYPATNVAISCATAGATIRYTTDGSEPDTASAVYSAPIPVTADTTIKACAYKTGMNPSATVTATYTYDTTRDAPAGDFFSAPVPLAGVSGTHTTADNSAYTLEDGEPYHTLDNGSYYVQAHSIWYAWTAPGNGTATFTASSQLVTTNGNTIYTTRNPVIVAAYVGDTLADATRIAFNVSVSGDYQAGISFAVEQGTEYRIVGAVMDEPHTGAFTLSWSGDLVATAVPPAVTNRYHGLFVGVNETAVSGFSALNGCVNDAVGMRNRFTDWGYCRREDTLLLTNALATAAAVRAALTNLAARAVAGDTVLYFQAGHGYLSTGATMALVEHDAYYWDHELAEDLGAFADGVRVVVVADTCNSGGLFKRGGGERQKFDLAGRVQAIMAANRSADRRLTARNLVSPDDIGWITAADYDEPSWDYGDHGLFTYYCLDGWATGVADADGDGRITFYEMWLSAKDRAAAFLVQELGSAPTEAQCLNETLLQAVLAGVTDASTAESETFSAPVRVPHAWLAGWMPALGYSAMSGGGYSFADYGAAANGVKVTPSGTPVAVWQDYVAGTDPTDPASVFRADIALTNGVPYITWSPDLGPTARSYRILGRSALAGAETWGPTNAASRFFKVEVQLAP